MEFYCIIDAGGRVFHAVVSTQDHYASASNRTGAWRVDPALLADIYMPEQQHYDWNVDEVDAAEVPDGWREVVSLG